MTEQTTGNEAREMVAYRHRYCGGRIHLERREDESTVGLAAICSSCGDTDGLDLEAVEVIPAPSIGEEPSDEAINAARVAMYANKIGTAHADYKAAEAILKAAYRIDFPSTTPPSGEADG